MHVNTNVPFYNHRWVLTVYLHAKVYEWRPLVVHHVSPSTAISEVAAHPEVGEASSAPHHVSSSPPHPHAHPHAHGSSSHEARSSSSSSVATTPESRPPLALPLLHLTQVGLGLFGQLWKPKSKQLLTHSGQMFEYECMMNILRSLRIS